MRSCPAPVAFGGTADIIKSGLWEMSVVKKEAAPDTRAAPRGLKGSFLPQLVFRCSDAANLGPAHSSVT